MKFIYTFSIYFYLFAIRIASLFNSKAKLWINGRKKIFETIQSSIVNQPVRTDVHPGGQSSIIWIHCASLGEFEQGRPLIERLRTQNTRHKILLTFFSPSGYEIRKNYAGADFVFYLPIDIPRNAKKFIELVKPAAVFFVKYEFWFNYLNELKKQNVPTYLVSGIFRKDHYFFKGYSDWFRKQLNCFTHFFLQDSASAELLKSIGYTNTTVAGDTRFDRVFEVSKNVKSIPFFEDFKQGKNVFIVGSSWKEDEIVIVDCRLPIVDFKLIIVPHEIDEDHLQSIERLFEGLCLRYSRANERNIKAAHILIIDNIGMLSSLYQYGTIAFIGGGFGKGVHNILEAATFGLPVIFGPNYQKFTEAKELINLGGAFSVEDSNDLGKTIQLLNDKAVLQTASHIAKHYVQSRVGATDKILDSLSI
ncbi:MAG: 3-deoxy-D-manno-octulosonic acid transferase [Bacteroidota bacterium]